MVVRVFHQFQVEEDLVKVEHHLALGANKGSSLKL